MELQALAAKGRKLSRGKARRSAALYTLLKGAGLRGKSVRVEGEYRQGVLRALHGLGAKIALFKPYTAVMLTRDILAGMDPGKGRAELLTWAEDTNNLIVGVDNNHGPNHWTPRDVADILEPRGFRVVRIARCGTKSECFMLLRRTRDARPAAPDRMPPPSSPR